MDFITQLDAERAVTTREVSRLLGLAEITVTQMRARGEGPPFFKVGHRNIRYRLADVLAWRDARTIRRAMDDPDAKEVLAIRKNASVMVRHEREMAAQSRRRKRR